MRNFPRRFGGFLTMVGVVLLLLFFLSDSLGVANGWYLLIGTLLIGIGGTLLWRTREKPGESGRFRMLRRMRSGDKMPRRKRGSRRGKKRGGGKDEDEDDEKEEI